MRTTAISAVWDAVSLTLCVRYRSIVALLWVTACLMAAGCGSLARAPEHSRTGGHPFPAALLAEPIELRAGRTHLTQPFVIKAPGEQWDVALGFIRTDSKLTPQQRVDGGADTCWTNTPREGNRPFNCKNTAKGFSLHWELLRNDGVVTAQFQIDSLVPNEFGSAGVYVRDAITRTLSGFANQAPGTYRMRVTVLRDAKVLDFLKPHIVVEVPFLLRSTPSNGLARKPLRIRCPAFQASAVASTGFVSLCCGMPKTRFSEASHPRRSPLLSSRAIE